MAYQARRKKIFKEEFQLVDENGDVVKTMDVELDPDVVAVRISEKYVNLQNCLSKVRMMKTSGDAGEMYETIGMSMKEIMQTVFGEGNSTVIMDFYNGRYAEMCREILPFVEDIVIPTVRKISQENRKNIISGYNRKQRRLFGKKHF